MPGDRPPTQAPRPEGVPACHAFAEKKGYSGVALYRQRARQVKRGLRAASSTRGRTRRASQLWVVSLYCPPLRGPRTEKSKFRFLKVSSST